MLTKSQKDLLAVRDRQASAALEHGFDSAAAHWQHVRAIARNGTTYDELAALFRGCFEDDVMDALLASQETTPTIQV